ncbi:MAG: O-antigen ligase family protein, partial [Planctomycetota bacterium]
MTHPPTPTPWSSHAVVWLAAAALALAPVSIFAVQIACLLLVIVALPHIPRRIWRSERALLIAIGLVAAAWLLSWSMSPVGPRAFYEAKDLWAVLLLPAVIAVRHLLWPRRHMLMMALALGLVVALAWSCVQLATGRDYIRGVSLQAEWGANWRPTGFYHSAMTFGGMSALCICAFGAFTFAPGVGLRQRALHGLALVAAVAALIISGSRSYQIALPILVVVWGVSRGRKGLIAAWSALVVGTTVVVMAGPAMLGMGRFEMPALQYTPDPQAPTVFSITTPPTQDERIPLWTVGLECINDHPWTGTGKGPAGYNATIEPYIEQFHDRTGVKLLRNHLHNNYLQVLVETGVI